MKRLEQKLSENLLLTTSRHETQASNSVREYSSDPIPVDLLMEIFSRVPLKSIARFRCASKFLAFILRRHDFTELFLTKSLTRPLLLFIVKTKGKLLFYSSPQPHINPDDNSSLLATSYHPTLVPDYQPTYICKPVCGLVLLEGSGRRKRPLICNPAKGKVRNLPNVPRKGRNTPQGIYLGYDPIAKQFKVLCLSMNNSLYSSPNTHWILTLESGKRSWRSLERPGFNFEGNGGGADSNICINGILYFGGWLEGSSVIVWFDVRSEKFGFIYKDEDMLIPKPFAYHYTSPSTLFNYKDKLGIHRRVGQNHVLWVVEDAGNHKWSKHSYELPPLGDPMPMEIMFLGMTSTGEIVYSSDSSVWFYNIKRNSIKRSKYSGTGRA